MAEGFGIGKARHRQAAAPLEILQGAAGAVAHAAIDNADIEAAGGEGLLGRPDFGGAALGAGRSSCSQPAQQHEDGEGAPAAAPEAGRADGGGGGEHHLAHTQQLHDETCCPGHALSTHQPARACATPSHAAPGERERPRPPPPGAGHTRHTTC
ncbi:hypothetical protein ACRC7T_13575 [Segnochrobactraceae bacterium EtOH-i3]